MMLIPAIRAWWKEQRQRQSLAQTARRLLWTLWEFARESTPEQRRRRYGDMDFDWERRVDTTGATVGWRSRLLGMFHSSYQPTEPAAFHEMMSRLPINFAEFTFVDLGSGKARVLLMAADYPFRRVLGVELLPELHRVAQENIARYHSELRRCAQIESVCADGRDFVFPPEPTVLFLFNPLPEPGFAQVIVNVENSLRQCPRPFYMLYHNPVWEHLVARSPALRKIGGTQQYAIYERAR